MNEPPRSRLFRRRMILSALWLWGSMCLPGAADEPGPRILTRPHGHERATDSASPSLKRRLVRAKITPISPSGDSHRLIVKFTDALEARANRNGSLTVNSGESGKTSALRTVADSLQLRFRPLQAAPEASLKALRKRAELRSGTQQPDPMSLVEVVARDASPETIRTAAAALLRLASVEYVEIESIDAPPPPPSADVFPTTPCLVSYQNYRSSSQGIGVDYVWESHGIQGHPSLRITDCEYLFNSRHEDLDGRIATQPGVSSMYSGYGDSHGTAAIGILAAGDNGYGMSGAAPDCQMYFYPEYAVMDSGFTQIRAATITAAIAASSPGDIVMLEMQTVGPNGKYGPAEYQPSVWDAVKTGTDAGVIIIAAAGNDHEDLDGSGWEEYRSRGDSGAIIVGGGDTSRSRQWFSTHGSRVDLQGWGSGVASTGYGTLATYGADPNQQYTSTFNGTSSATPIVAAAAALLQSVAIDKLGVRLTPAEMRSLLVATGNPQTGDPGKPIGPLPDLTAAVPQLLAAEFSTNSPLAIPTSGEASPSTIAVSGVSGVVSSVRVRINGLNHSAPRNLELLLVGPGGQVATLMSDAGGSAKLTNATLMFDDTAATALPESCTIVAGRYRPTNYGSSLETPPLGTVGSLNALAADGANGDWKLYLKDGNQGDTGSIASWSVSFETTPLPPDLASLSVPTPRQAYEAWLNSQVSPSASSASPPSDGVPSLLKYAFNLNPSAPGARTLKPGTGTTGLPCLTCDNSSDPPVFRLEYLRRRNSGPDYTPLQMSDPGNGPRTPMTGTTTYEDIDPDWQRVIIEQPIDPLTPRRFFTVEVTLPDDPP